MKLILSFSRYLLRDSYLTWTTFYSEVTAGKWYNNNIATTIIIAVPVWIILHFICVITYIIYDMCISAHIVLTVGQKLF